LPRRGFSRRVIEKIGMRPEVDYFPITCVFSVDADSFKGKFVRGPKLADVPYPVSMEPNLVVEFYSR
jgi:small subunit ribosomal protein S4